MTLGRETILRSWDKNEVSTDSQIDLITLVSHMSARLERAMRRTHIYLRKIGLAIVAASLIFPLLLYMHHTAGTGKIDAFRWTLSTIMFWVGLILWMANRSRKP